MKSLKFLLVVFVISLSIVNFAQKKPVLMWFDATANYSRFSYKDSIIYYLDKVKKYSITDIVVDIKPITGEVLYKSKIAPQMTEWNGVKREFDWDFLGYFIDEGHKRGLKVHVSLNIFCSGHNYMDRGVVYDKHPEWQSINYTDSGMVPITKLKHKYSAMTNPANDEVRDYELSLLEEIAEMYPALDGVFLDRTRYDCIESDFSDVSREKFEDYIGEKVKDFPNDIFSYEKVDEEIKRVPGKYYKEWIEWRVSVIHSFIEEAREVVKDINPDIKFGAYTGAWYPLYYELGVNWASPKYDPSLEYEWATENYKNYGYANLLDIYSSGCYFFEVTKEDVARRNKKLNRELEPEHQKNLEYWYSVEGSAEIAKKVVMNEVPVIGGLYVEQYSEDPKQFISAIKMCLDKTDGLMIFDIVHIINLDWWEKLEILEDWNQK